MKVLIINGPNLQATGWREPEIYGHESFDEFIPRLGKHLNIETCYFQSNHEGALIDKLYEAEQGGYIGVILNAGAYTHTSIAIADAVRTISLPVVEVHLSNTAAREEYRHRSFVAAHCVGSIAGFGPYGYTLALEALIDWARKR